MNKHDINRIENALFILLQYRWDTQFDNIVNDVLEDYDITAAELFDILSDIKRYF